jgi:hypothetical protein
MRRDLSREKDELWNTAREQLVERCVFILLLFSNYVITSIYCDICVEVIRLACCCATDHSNDFCIYPS